jgi:hypothetical protein
VWLEQTKWMRLLPESVRQRVSADAYEELHAEKAFVARKGEPANSWIGVAEGLLKGERRFSQLGSGPCATAPSLKMAVLTSIIRLKTID